MWPAFCFGQSGADEPTMIRGEDVTVVVPAWGRYLRFLETLLPRLREEWPESRIIVVGDYSLRALPDRENDVDYHIVERHTSTGRVRNFGLAEVRTPWVMFFDADDLPVAGSGEVLRANCEGVICCSGTITAWNPSSSVRVAMGPRQRAIRLQARPQLLAIASVARNQFPVVGSMIQTAGVRSAGGFADDNYCEDWSLGTALAFRGSVRLLPTPTVDVRVTPDSQIAVLGTGWGILRRLPALHGRWIKDDEIPAWAKALFGPLSMVRVAQGVGRLFTGRRSHDDLIEKLDLRRS